MRLALILALCSLPGCYALNRLQGRDTKLAVKVDGAVMATGVGLTADSVMRTDSPTEYVVGYIPTMTVWLADFIVALATKDMGK